MKQPDGPEPIRLGAKPKGMRENDLDDFPMPHSYSPPFTRLKPRNKQTGNGLYKKEPRGLHGAPEHDPVSYKVTEFSHSKYTGD